MYVWENNRERGSFTCVYGFKKCERESLWKDLSLGLRVKKEMICHRGKRKGQKNWFKREKKLTSKEVW